MNETDEILDLLRENARLSVADISAMTKKSEEDVRAIIKKLEDGGIIMKYAAIVNPEKRCLSQKSCASRNRNTSNSATKQGL